VEYEENEFTFRAPPVGEELLRLLIGNLEYIFSRDYLSSDPLLVSQLDSDFFIPIALIVEHQFVKSLTTDVSIIHKALSSSEKIIIDQERQMAKPAEKLVLRNTLILRDIPKETTEAEIRGLFGSNETFLANIEEMKNEIGDTYFIKFASEEVTLEAWKFLRNQTFKDQPVQARIKSENLLRRSYYLDPSVAQHYQQQAAAAINVNPYTEALANNYKGNRYDGDGYRGDGRGRGRFNKRGGRKEFVGQGPDDRPFNKSGRGKYPGRKGGPTQSWPQGSGKNNIRPNQTTQLNQWWPPLPGSEQSDQTPGYKGEFKKYSKDQIVSIISGIPEKTPPVWSTTNTESIRTDGEALSVAELTRAPPKDAKIEWVETRRRPPNQPSQTPQQQSSQNKPKAQGNDKNWSSLLQNANGAHGNAATKKASTQ